MATASESLWHSLKLNSAIGMPQGFWLRPLTFILIDNLHLRLPIHKYPDDMTISETDVKDTVSDVQRTADGLTAWSENNWINVNCKRTKKMILGPLSKSRVAK